MKKYSLILTTLIWAVSVITHAATPDGKPEKTLPVQEKVYLHIDNNCYFLGDSIWYKAYVVLADNNVPEPLSRILYVELLNEQGYLMERQQLVVDEEGQADGCFAICDTTFAGFYEIRAYTKWMLNFCNEPLRSWHTDSWVKGGTDGMTAYPMDLNKGGLVDQGAEIIAPGSSNKLVDQEGKIIESNETQEIKRKAKSVTTFDDEYDSGYSIDKDGMRKLYRDNKNLFSRVFPVYTRPDSMENYRRKVMPTKVTVGDYRVWWKTPEFDVKFYPEGGNLLEGVQCRVGWEAFTQELERLNVNGKLMEDGEQIDSIMSYHAGRGFFVFTPRPKKKYKAVFNFGDHRFTFDLPKAMTQGARLVVEQDAEGVYFNVAKRFDNERKLKLTIYCRGRKIQTLHIDESGNNWDGAVYQEDLPEGVNQAVVTDEQGNVYADRLFFINRIEEAKGKILVAGISKRAYQPLEKIRLNLIATDSKGRALKEQTFSVAVRDADQLDATFASGNILTNLLLESEIRGFVENPDYYFEANDEKHRTALDLLLMIQGWRRYNWRDVEQPEKFVLSYMPEQKMIIYGQAFPLRRSLFTKDQGRLMISCSLMNLNDDLKDGDYYLFKGAVEADTAGFFQIAYEPFYGTVKLALRAKFVKKMNKKKYDLLTHDDKIFLRKQYFYPQALKELSWYETNSPDFYKEKKLTWEDFQQDIYASEWIPQVNIKSKKRPHAELRIDKPVQVLNFIDFVNDTWDQGFYNQFFLLDGHEFDLGGIIKNIYDYTRHEYTTSSNNPESQSLYFDWSQPTDLTFSIKRFLPLMKSIWIVNDSPRRPTSFEYYHLDRVPTSGGSIGIEGYTNIITRQDDEDRPIYLGREYNFQGFTRPVEYYNPDYSKANLPEIKDYRRTLYWNPKVTTDKYGQASIEFYNNSVCKLIDLQAEGITKNGECLVTAEAGE